MSCSAQLVDRRVKLRQIERGAAGDRGSTVNLMAGVRMLTCNVMAAAVGAVMLAAYVGVNIQRDAPSGHNSHNGNCDCGHSLLMRQHLLLFRANIWQIFPELAIRAIFGWSPDNAAHFFLSLAQPSNKVPPCWRLQRIPAVFSPPVPDSFFLRS